MRDETPDELLLEEPNVDLRMLLLEEEALLTLPGEGVAMRLETSLKEEDGRKKRK